MAKGPGQPRGMYVLRRDESGMYVLDRELARRNMRLTKMSGVGYHTLNRLRRQPDGQRGHQTTLATAYRIARALDAEHADELIPILFETIDNTTASTAIPSRSQRSQHIRDRYNMLGATAMPVITTIVLNRGSYTNPNETSDE